MSIRVFRSLEEAKSSFGPSVVTIGNFDGVHCGHQALFRELVRIGSENRLRPSVLTFDPHPSQLLAPERAPKLLSTVEQRTAWMAECGIEQVIVLPFTRETSLLSPEDFVRIVLVDALDARVVLVGDNFRFGHRQAGDTAMLAILGDRFGFTARAVHAVRMRGVIVSSTEIRRAIYAGNVARAARLLGRFYALDGVVVRGYGIGRRQTVPTLNLATEAQVIPATGVYVTRTTDPDTGRQWRSVSNIGYRPTFGGDQLSVETFLLDEFDGETPARIGVELTHRIRAERRFENPEALKAQILQDAARAAAWHRRFAPIALLQKATMSRRYTN